MEISNTNQYQIELTVNNEPAMVEQKLSETTVVTAKKESLYVSTGRVLILTSVFSVWFFLVLSISNYISMKQ
jgi:hypothetical protein